MTGGDIAMLGWLWAGLTMIIVIVGVSLNWWPLTPYAWIVPIPGFVLMTVGGMVGDD